jgi:uncharacterized RDD family membrane protein YckC
MSPWGKAATRERTLSPDGMMATVDSAEPDPTQVLLRRGVQWGLDRLIVAAAAVPVLVLTEFAAFRALLAGWPSVVIYVPATLFLLVMIVGNWVIDVWLPHRGNGATPAMRWLGLRIVTERGGTPPLRAYTIRWLLSVVDGVLFGLVGAVTIAAGRRHQRVGDLVARTLVVRVR